MQDQTDPQNDRPAFMNVSAQEPSNEESPTSIVDPAPPPPPAPNSSGNIKKIAAILGVFVLVSATGAGVFLAGRQQLSPASAWDCGKYNFAVSREGVVSVINGSTKNEPIQKANVKVNNNQVAAFDVPALSPGQSSTLGTVTAPTSGSFSWEVSGTLNCIDGGSYQGQTGSAACLAVKAFNKDWQPLTGVALATLKTGDIVRFAALTTATTGSVDKARFTINGTQRPEVTAKRPGTDEYYDEYTVPAGTKNFVVTAQVHHQQTNQWHY